MQFKSVGQRWVPSLTNPCLLALVLAIITCGEAVSLPPSPQVSGKLVAVDRINDTLVSIDPDTLSVQTIGPLGVDYEFGGLAYNPNSQTLYMRSRANFYHVDVNTGHATYRGFDSRFYVSLGLAFDSTRNQLLTTDQGGAATYLVQVNPANGAWMTALNEGVSVQDGMAYNAENDQLYGVTSNGPQAHLWLIDRTIPHKITLINQSSPYAGDAGLAYDPVRDYVWMTSLLGRITAYDRNNNFQIARQSPTRFVFDSLEFIPPIPEPGAMALVICGFTLGVSWRRRLERTR
jgi:hypothetical protein